MTNLSQWCVPRGSQPNTYSAPTMASAKLFRVRFSVEITITPPGRIRAQRLRKADIGYMLDHFHGQHGVEAFAHVHLLDGGQR